MMRINEEITRKLVEQQYYEKDVLFERLERDMNTVLVESGGISKEVVRETERIKRVIKDELGNGRTRSLTNGVGQTNVSFNANVFMEQYRFNVSLINYRNYEVYSSESKNYTPFEKAEIDPKAHIFNINMVSISQKIVEPEYLSSIQHELQHYYDVYKSKYSWGDDDAYTLSLKLMRGDYDFDDIHENTRNLLYSFGVLFYLSFKQEQRGFANGLYASLKSQNIPKTSKDIDKAAMNDDSFRGLTILRTLENILFGTVKNPCLNDAIKYLNTLSQKQYTQERLKDMCYRVEHDFMACLNRAKGEYMSPNDGMYEMKIYKLSDRKPFIVHNNKILSE